MGATAACRRATRWRPHTSSAPSANTASEIQRAGSRPCQSARWYSSGPGSSSAYAASSGSIHPIANAATRLAAERMPGATPMAGLSACSGVGSTPALVKNAPQTKRTV